MSYPAVQFGRIQPGGPLVVMGSPGSGAAPPVVFIMYVQPTAAIVLPNDTVISDIDPTRATVLPNDASFTDIDPTRATAIQ